MLALPIEYLKDCFYIHYRTILWHVYAPLSAACMLMHLRLCAGFVSGDFAGRWYLQHKLHQDNVEQFRRPFQVLMAD